MQLAPPHGSAIGVAEKSGIITLRWENQQGGAGRYFSAAFLMFWLCAWTVGEFTAGNTLWHAHFGDPTQLFMLVWLTGWTLGGLLAVISLVRIFSGAQPEILRLTPDLLDHDPGTDIPMANKIQWQDLRTFFTPAMPLRANRAAVLQIRIDQLGEKQRLYLDIGVQRIEVGRNLREPEREWLAALLRDWLAGALFR